MSRYARMFAPSRLLKTVYGCANMEILSQLIELPQILIGLR